MQISEVVSDLAPTAATTVDARGDVALAGSRCGSCGKPAFPARAVCYRCGRRDPTPSALSAVGVLYSWTTVRVSASRPTPYDVGYVDLDGSGLRVFGQLVGSDRGWHVGTRLRAAVVDSPDGWAFVPEPAEGSSPVRTSTEES